MLLLNSDAFLVRNSLDLGHCDRLALGFKVDVTLLLILGLDNSLDDGVGHVAADAFRNVAALLLVLGLVNDLALLLRDLRQKEKV